MSKYDELIERLEKLTGPDREVDRAIGRAIGKSETTFPQYEPDCVMPYYTASIDAALTLVPEGCHVTLEQDADTQGRDLADDEPLEVSAKNTLNLAMAFCIAALRARAEQEKK